MRLNNTTLPMEDQIPMRAFADWVLAIGEGRAKGPPACGAINKNLVQVLPQSVLFPKGPKIPAICDAVYTDFKIYYNYVPYLAER